MSDTIQRGHSSRSRFLLLDRSEVNMIPIIQRDQGVSDRLVNSLRLLVEGEQNPRENPPEPNPLADRSDLPLAEEQAPDKDSESIDNDAIQALEPSRSYYVRSGNKQGPLRLSGAEKQPIRISLETKPKLRERSHGLQQLDNLSV